MSDNMSLTFRIQSHFQFQSRYVGKPRNRFQVLQTVAK